MFAERIRRNLPLLFSLTLVLVILVLAFPAVAQKGGDPQLEGTQAPGTSQMPPPVVEKFQWLPKPPPLTAKQIKQLEQALESSHLPGPDRDTQGILSAPPAPGTESVVFSGEILREPSLSGTELEFVGEEGKPGRSPLAPSSFTLYRSKAFGSALPANRKSNTMEMSVSNSGRFVFATGNWFAARSTNGGQTWSYISPYSGFASFCCDQLTVYDGSRNILLWLRQGRRDASGSNVFKLSVSKNQGATWCTYTTSPTNVNSSWTNQWFDYPKMQVGGDFLYITFNIFNASKRWVRTVILRWPLDKLRACQAFSYNYFATRGWFTIVPVQGANHHVMYFASNRPRQSPWNRIRIWKWEEDSSVISWVTRTVPQWTYTGFSCGTTANWLGRADDRLQTGVRYTVNNDRSSSEPRIRGKSILMWMWNAGTDSSFPYPHIEAAAFYEANLQQVSGWRGRPLVWNSTTCFAYPAVASNERGDLGLVFHYSVGSKKAPAIGAAIADDFVHAPPGWIFYRIRASSALPSDNKWGDYNSIQPFDPSGKAWIAGAHFINTTTDCSKCGTPLYFVFGRQRDYRSWLRWRSK